MGKSPWGYLPLFAFSCDLAAARSRWRSERARVTWQSCDLGWERIWLTSSSTELENSNELNSSGVYNRELSGEPVLRTAFKVCCYNIIPLVPTRRIVCRNLEPDQSEAVSTDGRNLKFDVSGGKPMKWRASLCNTTTITSSHWSLWTSCDN